MLAIKFCIFFTIATLSVGAIIVYQLYKQQKKHNK